MIISVFIEDMAHFIVTVGFTIYGLVWAWIFKRRVCGICECFVVESWEKMLCLHKFYEILDVLVRQVVLIGVVNDSLRQRFHRRLHFSDFIVWVYFQSKEQQVSLIFSLSSNKILPIQELIYSRKVKKILISDKLESPCREPQRCKLTPATMPICFSHCWCCLKKETNEFC